MKPSLLLLLGLAALGAQDLPPATLARLADLQKTGKWAELADAFESLTPRERGLYLGSWMDALERSQRWERLLTVCESLEPQLKGKGALEDVQRRKVKALVKLQRFGEAAQTCEVLGDAGASIFYVFGLDYARQGGDWPRLEGIASKLLAQRAKDPMGLAVKGEALARMERFAEAEPFLEQAAVANPKDAWVLVNLANCLNERKAWSEALAACDRALTLNPDMVQARINRGRACFELGRYAEAKADYEAALTLLPGNPMLLENLRQATRYLEIQPKARKAKG